MRADTRAPDHMVRTLSREGGIAVRAIVGTRLVAEAARRHDTSPTATAVEPAPAVTKLTKSQVWVVSTKRIACTP